MRHFHTLLCILIVLISCSKKGDFDQNNRVDQELTDSLLASKYYQLSYNLSNSYPDSAMHYAWKSYNISHNSENYQQIANALSQIAYTHAAQNQLDSSIVYYEKASNEYLTIRDTNRYLVMQNNMGGQLIQKGDYKEALTVLSDAKQLAIEKKWDNHIADSYRNLGLMEDYKGNVTPSLEYYNHALTYAQKTDDTLKWMSIYNNIGVLFYFAEEYERAIPYLQKAEIYNQEKGNYFTLADNYINLGVSFDMLGQDKDALRYLVLALKTGEHLNNITIQAKSRQNIGALLLDSGDTIQALKNFDEALRLKKEVNEKQSLSNTYQYLARINLGGNDTLKIRSLLDSALLTAFTVESKEQIINCYALFVEYYKKVEDFKLALHYQEKKELVADSLFDKEKMIELYKLEMNRISDKEQKEFNRMSRKTYYFKWVAILSCCMLVLVIFIFSKRMRKNKQRLAIEQQQAKDITKELVHRVNGQFTITEWYLQLKENNLQKSKIEETISDIRNFVEALSVINQELSSHSITPLSSSLRHISENLNIVISELLNKDVHTQIDVQDVDIPNRDIIYLCTLFNELTMNSAKYAFDTEENPAVFFQLEEMEDGFLQCTYRDNGIGHNPESKSTGQGLKIIAKIIESLKGTFTINRENGFVFLARFKKRSKDEQLENISH